MNLLLVEPEEIRDGGRVVLTDRRAEHLIRVLNVRVGQTIRAGVVRGPLARATIVAVSGRVELELDLGVSIEVPLTDLVLAMPRPKALPRVVQAAASFGIRRIDIINTWRVDASYFSSPKLLPDVLAFDARLGCEQGRQTYIPEIEVYRLFVPYVEEVLRPRLATQAQLSMEARLGAQASSRLLIADPGAPRRVEEVMTNEAALPVTLAIGPDGGFVERELVSLESLGGTAVNFGQAVLRSETAVVAILSQVDLLRRLGSGPRCRA